MIKYSGNVDPTSNSFVDFLKSYGIFLAIGVAAIVAIIVIVILFVQKRGSKEKPIEAISYDSESIFIALGSKENVVNHYKNGSRIVVELKDYSLVDENKLNSLGVDSIIKMSNKITLVVKSDPDSFYKQFN